MITVFNLSHADFIFVKHIIIVKHHIFDHVKTSRIRKCLSNDRYLKTMNNFNNIFPIYRVANEESLEIFLES